MPEIQIRGGVVLIDEGAVNLVAEYDWRVRTAGRNSYAMAGHRTLMHRLIMGAPDGVAVDHINRNGLDNRRDNLRLCTTAQNIANGRHRIGTASLFKGVYAKAGKWQSFIRIAGKLQYLGYFSNERDAAAAYDAAAKAAFGAFAALNFPEKVGK